MPINHNLPAVSELDVASAMANVQSINTLLPYLIQLTPKEKQQYAGIKNKRETLSEKLYHHASNNSLIVPAFVSLPMLDQKLSNYKRLKSLENVLQLALEKVRDTAHNEGHLAFKEALKIYDMVEMAVNSNVPGIDTIYADVKPFFPQAGRKKKKPL